MYSAEIFFSCWKDVLTFQVHELQCFKDMFHDLYTHTHNRIYDILYMMNVYNRFEIASIISMLVSHAQSVKLGQSVKM